MFRRCILLLALMVSATLAGIASADEPSAKSVLSDKGLRNVGKYWILRGEKDLGKRLKSFGRFRMQVSKAVQQRDEFEQNIAAIKKSIRSLYAERMQKSRELGRADSGWAYNKAVSRINEITDQMSLYYQSIADAEHDNPARRALAAAKDAYLAELIEMQAMAKKTQADYDLLSNDAEVRDALEELSAIMGKAIKLGPRKVFGRYVKDLAALASVVQTDKIDLERHGEVFYVNTVINGEHHERMMFDTGASIVLLPHKLAERIGLRPTDDDPRIQLTIANGQRVEGILMTLDSLQIGNARAQNVECTVLPAEMAEVTPLLGGTFLRHFNYSISPDAGILTLTRIESPDKKRSSGKKRRR